MRISSRNQPDALHDLAGNSIVSGISYLSYLLKRYVFHQSGILVSGIVGGLYSSTATISILARKCKLVKAPEIPEYVAAMLLAVSMMYLRFMILILIFSKEYS